MIKIFERNGHLNFIDGNDTFVGYDYSAQCCEDFWYSISDNKDFRGANYDKSDYDQESLLECYLIDTEYFLKDEEGYNSTAQFRLFDPYTSCPDKYLTLYNSHNGYYFHGFSMSVRTLQGSI